MGYEKSKRPLLLPAVSTVEVDTGQKWLDGKTIYRKVIDIGALPNATTKNVAHSIVTLDSVVRVSGVAVNATPARIPLPYVTQTLNQGISVGVDNTNVTLVTGIDYSAYTGKVVLEYTKS